MVKLFTIVKDEVDIVKDWIIYHGSLFGWNNIYIIDNYSTDGTYETIMDLKNLGINVFRETDYRKKGEYMTNLIKIYCNENETLAFPLDIDEFVAYYEKGSKELIFDKTQIQKYIHNLPKSNLYKANYLMPILKNKNGSERATAEIDYAFYSDYGSAAKSFFDIRYFDGVIDHGNHIHSDNYYLTNIVLIHYHQRNIEQMKKKSLNNVVGLGYSSDIKEMINFIELNPYCDGNHHLKIQIAIANNSYGIGYDEHAEKKNNINITSFKQRIIDGYF